MTYKPCHERKPIFPTRSDTNRAVRPQVMVRALKSRILKDGMHYPCCENKDADQLRYYCAADLRLCFHICKPEDQWSCKRSPDISA